MSARQRGLAIAAKHDVARPRRECPRHLVAATALSVHGDRLVAEFPSVAVRALEHALPVQGAGARNRRQPVEYARCVQQLTARNAGTAVRYKAEPADPGSPGGLDLRAPERHSRVLQQFSTGELAKMRRWRAIPRQECVLRLRRPAPGRSGIANEHATAGAPEYQPGAQPRRSTADDHDIPAHSQHDRAVALSRL